jgi:4-amino-4-deoxy-L-arabinose transferase-like glycosyltransferase
MPHMSWKTHLAAISLIAGVVMFTNLGGPKLWDRDEPRNAGCAKEMLERGDWVTPVFNGELRSHKPVLLYWFMISAYQVFGVNEFSARLWSAIFALGTCYCTYGIGRRLFNPQAGLWGAVILTTLMFGVAGRAATPDSVLIFFNTLALAWYVHFAFPNSHETDRLQAHGFPQSILFAVVLYGIMGIAVLAKGPIGVVLPCAVIGLYLLIRNASSRYGSPAGWKRVVRPVSYFLETCWQMRVLSASLIVLAVAAPWYIWVGYRTDGAWLRKFFLEHNIGRAMQPMEGHGGPGIFFYLAALLIGFTPWSFFFFPTIADAWKRYRANDGQRNGILFLACWVVVYLGMFSFAGTKLPSYITPCYPAVALLVAAFMHRWSEGKELSWCHWPKVSFILWGLTGIGLVIGLPIVAEMFLPGMEWLGLLGLIPLIVGISGYLALTRKRQDCAALIFANGAFLFVWISFGFLADKVDDYQKIDHLVAELQLPSESPQIAQFQTLEPTWVFYSSTTVRPVSFESRKPLDKGERGGVVWVKHPEMDGFQFLEESSNHYVLMTKENFESIEQLLPENVGIVVEIPYFFRRRSLVAVGQVTSQASSEPDRPESTLLQ